MALPRCRCLPRRAAAPALALGLGLALAACSSGGSTPRVTGGVLVTAGSSPLPLPFGFQKTGEGSSPEFAVRTAGSYSVAYVVRGSGCTVSLALTADDGTSAAVASGVQLQSPGTQQGSRAVTLAAGTWRFEEGGGCTWQVRVSGPD